MYIYIELNSFQNKHEKQEVFHSSLRKLTIKVGRIYVTTFALSPSETALTKKKYF